MRNGRDAPSAVREALRERGSHLERELHDDLLLLLTELVTNAVEHGLKGRGGTVTVSASRSQRVDGVDGVVGGRSGERLTAVVRDDGTGLPDGFDAGSAGLGSQIVQALVSGDMRGRITWRRPPEGGAEVTV